MPRHHRPERGGSEEGGYESGHAEPQASSAHDLKALSSSVLLLSQKIQHIIRNEKVLGRNLLVLNRKLADLGKKGVLGKAPFGRDGNLGEKVSMLSAEIDKLEQSVFSLREKIAELKKDFVKKEDFKEIKYMIDTINPLDFVSHKELDERLARSKKPKKSKRSA